MMHAQPDAKIEIILVEDRPEDVAFTVGVLKKANVFNKITVIDNASELMDFLRGHGRFARQEAISAESMILLSLSLIETPALDLLRKVKADERTKSLPVVMLASSHEERGVMESYKLGATACILKPFDLPKFVEAVAESRLGWLLVSGDSTTQ